ncbi:MAG: helix-turn-helix domain-containing protein [Gammaproteobacteria bacterium]|nr:helix-turn-helix domain-containing protein [Gammaproteobacteria bacterium]
MSANESITETSVISYTIDGASEATGIPKSTLWEHIKSGRLASLKVGRRRLIPRESLVTFVRGGSSDDQ